MKALVKLSALGIGIASLAACGGGSEEPAPDTGATTAAAPAASPTTVAPPPAADSTDTLDGTTLAQFTGNAENGEKVFLQCKSCHVRDPGVNRIGPSLAGIVGRAAGTVEGFNYTDANKNSGITWAPEKLYQYLENPQRVVPGTKMAFAGLPNGQDRADIIAYLQTE